MMRVLIARLDASPLAARLGYSRDDPLEFSNQRLCGLWLIWIGAVLLVATLLGGEWLINPVVFGIGYLGGIAVIFGPTTIQRRLSGGPESRFQASVFRIALGVMFVVMALVAGRSIPALDFRVIWLAALLGTGIHFIPLILVHGPPMLWLAVPLTANALIGLLAPGMAFEIVAAVDGVVKVGFGIGLLQRPTRGVSTPARPFHPDSAVRS
jgi:hypothetical protein